MYYNDNVYSEIVETLTEDLIKFKVKKDINIMNRMDISDTINKMFKLTMRNVVASA
jgi:hypothetical protein